MQSGQNCLIYHMLGNSLRRLHASRTKTGSRLTGWFAERLWAELAFKPFSSPGRPSNASFLRCALLFPSSIQVTTKIFNNWKLPARRVQSADCRDTDNRNRGSRNTSCKNRMREDFAICHGWVGEKLFRALRDAQLCCMSQIAIDFWFCKKRKLLAIWIKGLLREHSKSQVESKEGMKVPWSHLDFQKILHPSHPERSSGSAQLEQRWLYTHKSVFCDHSTNYGPNRTHTDFLDQQGSWSKGSRVAGCGVI